MTVKLSNGELGPGTPPAAEREEWPLLEHVARQSCRSLGASACAILAADPATGARALRAVAGCGGAESLLGTTVVAYRGLAARALRTGAPVVARAGTRFVETPTLSVGGGVREIAAAPIHADGERWGVLCLFGESTLDRDDEHAHEDLADLAELASAAVESGIHRLRLRQSFAAAVGALGGLLDLRDGYTGCHTDEVVELCCAVGHHLGLAPQCLADLDAAARLHDLGKIGVPDEILHKQGPLSSREWSIMRKHPVWGAEALARVPGFDAVAAAVRAHHERWDGSGYPDGLVGEAIPRESRIIAVADAYHAMTSTRPYRSALSTDEARRRIQSGAGTDFEPRVAHALLAVLDR